MTYKVVLPVKDNTVVIHLPPDFSGSKKVVVSVDIPQKNKRQKMDELKEAMSDPLFLADVQETSSEFNAIDAEITK